MIKSPAIVSTRTALFQIPVFKKILKPFSMSHCEIEKGFILNWKTGDYLGKTT